MPRHDSAFRNEDHKLLWFYEQIEELLQADTVAYIPSKKYADTKVPNTSFKRRNNIPETKNFLIAIQDKVIGTKVKETYLQRPIHT